MTRFLNKKSLLAVFLLWHPVAQPAFKDIFTALGFQDIVEKSKDLEAALNRDSIEARKRQLVVLQSKLEVLQKDIKENVEKIMGQRHKVAKSITFYGDRLSLVPDQDSESVRAIISTLNARDQYLSEEISLWERFDDILEKHIQVIKESIKWRTVGLGAFSPGKKETYTLQSLEERINQQQDISSELKKTLKQKEKIESNKTGVINNKNSAKNELESYNRDVDRLAGAQEANEYQRSLLNEKMRTAEERINLEDLKFRKLSLELMLINDQIDISRVHQTVLDQITETIKKSVVVYRDEVNTAYSDLRDQEARGKGELEFLQTQIKRKGEDREHRVKELEQLRARLGNLKESEGADGLNVFMSESKALWQESKIGYLAREVSVLELKKADIEKQRLEKSFAYNFVRIQHRIGLGEESFEEWMGLVGQEKAQLEEALIFSKTKREEAVNAADDLGQLLGKIRKKRESFELLKIQPSDQHEIQFFLKDAQAQVEQSLARISEGQTLIPALIQSQERLLERYNLFLKELDNSQKGFDIFKRSSSAMKPEVLLKAWEDVELFFGAFFWDTYRALDFGAIVSIAAGKPFNFWFGLLLCIIAFFFVQFLVAGLLVVVQRRLSYLISLQHGRTGFLYLNILSGLFEFLAHEQAIIVPWLFIHLNFVFDITYFTFKLSLGVPYLVAFFYLATIPLFLALSKRMILLLTELNTRLSFFFFNEKTQGSFISALRAIFYLWSVVFPLRWAFFAYPGKFLGLPSVLITGFFLIFAIIVLLFFNRDDILSLIPSHNRFFMGLRGLIESYYYPVLFFCMGLIILMNPYIGYVHLAKYLALVVPVSGCVIYGMLLVHAFIRQVAYNFLFLEEREDELVDRFEFSKIYYGMAVLLTFVILAVATFGLMAKVWGFPYTIESLWETIYKQWTVGDENIQVGLIQLIIFGPFLLCGYIASTLCNRFILMRVFDVLRAEPGTQNMFSSILHYAIIVIAIVSGLTAIGLAGLVPYFITGIGLIIAFGGKDMVGDFMAGLLLLVERQVEIGHYVQIDEKLRGTVYRISARSTTIRTASNYFVILPNSELVTKPIVNWGMGRFSVGFELTVTAEYTHDPEQILEIMRKVIYDHPLVLRVPTAVFRFEEFGDSGAKYFARAFVSIRKVREQWEVASDIRIGIHKLFKQYGILFPYPRRIIHLGSSRKVEEPVKITFDDRPMNEERVE